ncbi:MFS transporter [Streptomyces sp. NPDC017056]|uniref:MFS transporter n=1 Tax=Streptomyces sp. NPDC017056 TaxID=3364973 RepID=UPI0037ADF063
MDANVSVKEAGSASARTTLWQWVAVAVLSLSTFVVVTSEMLPVGVLTPMADGLHISSGRAGFSLTITGLVTAVTAPLVVRVVGALDRRAVLAAAMVVLAVGNALTAAADDFGLLVVSRVVVGVGMGAVWGLASAVAARLVAPRNVALAVSCTIGGVAAASVIGVPLGTVVGNAFGWRTAFAALSAAAVALAVGLLLALPRLPRPAASGDVVHPTRREPLLRTAPVTVGLVLIVFLVTAHFAAYTYVRPVLEERVGSTPGAISLLLLVYGLFGLIGNFVAGASAARRARGTVLGLTTGIGAGIALLAVFGSVTAVAGVGIALWGLAYGGLSVAGQIWMAQAAPERIEHITGIYVGVFTAAIALGAFLGGVVVETVGITPLLWSATALAGAALAVGLFGPGPSGPSGPSGRARRVVGSPAVSEAPQGAEPRGIAVDR